MLFNPILFAIFLPIVFLLYWFVYDHFISNSKWQLHFAKRLRRDKLRVLRLVGLAFFIAHHIHFVLLVGQRIAYQKG